jgi:cytochrome c biogenesis protein
VFLMGNGYAPRFTVRDAAGTVVFAGAVPFLPQDTATFTSTGVIKVPDIAPEQLGFSALFLPTAQVDPVRGPVSVYPDALNPEVFLGAYKGDLGIDAGLPKSVYRLDTDDMTLVANGRLLPGQTLTLPDGLGSITYDGWTRWANFQVADDPGRLPALLAAVGAIVGLMLSLFIRRRRVWVRAVPGPDGRTVVEVAGLARSESPALDEEVGSLADELMGAGRGAPTDKE